MAKKLNSMPDYQARMPRQPHDVSQSFTFTSSTGMELPVYFDMLHLGDELHFNGGMFARLNPLTVPTLGKIDIHLDYFFIPLSVMYTPSPSLFYQTDDLLSSLIVKQSLNKDSFPLYDIDGSVIASLLDSGGSFDYTIPDRLYTNQLDLNINIFDCRAKAIVRLLDMLHYSIAPVFSQQASGANPHTTPWFLAAYHACHQLYFRNDDREIRNYDSYNFDSQYNQTTAIAWSPNMLHLNYVSGYKDYFNAVKVSPVGSSVSMLNGGSSWSLLSKVDSYLYSQGSYIRSSSTGTGQPGSALPDSDSTTIKQFQTNSTSYPQGGLNAANIRQLFMVDKLLRVSGRANKDYESQFLAHFGVKVPHDVMHNITHIGHDMASIEPDAVVSSANTFDPATGTGSALGEIGGQGYIRFSGKKRNFKAPCHGVFMCIYHAVPRFRYVAGIDKLHDLSDPMKFWQPEYDRKGMQPLFKYEVVPNEQTLATTRFGWQFAYEQFKRKFDRVSLAFTSRPVTPTVNEYASWVLSRIPFYVPYQNIPSGGTSGQGGLQSLDVRNFLSTPHDLDMIMQIPYQSSWISGLTLANAHELFLTDPLINDFHMTCKKVNFMSEYGEPELD